MTEHPIQLDDRQRAAASVDPEVRQIVLASPGSGKTEVVAALIEGLTETHGLSPAEEILAISFSRAAVAALRGRVPVQQGGPAMAVRTLDSLASHLLEELDDEEWQHLSFDRRIERALELLRAGAESVDLELVRHLIVDEVQDLVGVRAELVLAILERLPQDVGFTLLGDPRQAVFNFQLRAESDMTSGQFLDRVKSLGRVEETALANQYRARSVEATRAAALSARAVAGDEWVKEVRTFASRLFMAGEVAALAGAVHRWSGTTAFLCRTNGDALVVGGVLRAAGVPATVRSTAEALPVAPWLAEAFGDAGLRQLPRAVAIQRLEVSTPMGGEAAWRLLKAMERDYRSADRLDLRKVAARIAIGDVPAELLGESGSVVVSTIHRAKGLEFDNVILVNPGNLLPGGATPDDAAVAYVALTRARDQVIAARCDLPRFLRVDKVSGRWIVGGFKPWHTFGFEVRGEDTRTDDDIDLDPVQRSLAVGTPVTAELDPRRSTLDLPVYSLLVDGHLVARTTPSFGETLARRLGGISKGRTPWPGLVGLDVEGIETLADSESPEGRLFRRGVRIGGLGTLDWGTTKGSDCG